MRSDRRSKPRVAVFKFASCDGCQLTILDAEEELLSLAHAVEIAFFPEATSRNLEGPYDIGLVEGSITTHHDTRRIQQVRRECRKLITIGACATAGGIQALRNWQELGSLLRCCYAAPAFISTLKTSTPIADHVPVDLELRGCPVSKAQLLEVLSAILAGREPVLPMYPVCLECKREGIVCLLVGKGEPCLGPVTQAGCGALCPRYDRPCFGCFGPSESPNTLSLRDRLIELGRDEREVSRLFRTFNAWSWPFRTASEDSGNHGDRR